MSKRKVASVLRSAANLIQRYGLAVGAYENSLTGFCTVGAVGKVVADDPSYVCNPLKSSLYNDVEMAIRSRIPQSNYGDVLDIFNWSDQTTAKDVIGLLRKTARDLEHGGKIDAR